MPEVFATKIAVNNTICTFFQLILQVIHIDMYDEITILNNIHKLVLNIMIRGS